MILHKYELYNTQNLKTYNFEKKISNVLILLKELSPKDKKAFLKVVCVDVESYYSCMEDLEASTLECSCGTKGCCIKYGHYPRIIIINDNGKTIKVYVQRVYCKHCKRTHAIMPSFVVPYEQKSFELILDTLIEYSDVPEFQEDPEVARYVSIYNNWENKMKTNGVSILEGLEKVITFCASTFRMCFMQNIQRKIRKDVKVEYYYAQPPT